MPDHLFTNVPCMAMKCYPNSIDFKPFTLKKNLCILAESCLKNGFRGSWGKDFILLLPVFFFSLLETADTSEVAVEITVFVSRLLGKKESS